MIRNGIILLILGYLAVYILPLGVRPMVIPDETRYAQMGREILDSGDWVVPHLNGLRYFEKPILGHWAHALSIRFLGANAFAARLPSALAAGLTALLLGLLVWRFGGGRVALLSAGLLLTFIEVYIVGTLCVLDSLLSLFVTGAMVAFFFAYQSMQVARQRIYWSLFGIACGLAFLTKGLLGFVIPGLAIVPFLLWQRRIRCLWCHLWLVIGAIVLTAGPWLILIHRREPDFLHYFFWVEHIERFLHPSGGQHREPFWYFIPVLLGGAFPWTLMFFPASLGLRHIKDEQGLLKFAGCWLVFPLLFFSASGGKLATYILPCFVPLAFLLATGLLAYGRQRHWIGALRVGAVLAVLALAILWSYPHVTSIPSLYGADEGGKMLLATMGLLVFAIGWWQTPRRKSVSNGLVFSLLVTVFMMGCIPWIVPDRLRTRKMPGDFLSKHAADLQPQTLVFSDANMAAAVCWFTGRRDVVLLGNKGELEYGLDYEDARQRFLPAEQFHNFLREHPDKNLVLVTRQRDYESEYVDLFQDPTTLKTEQGFIWLEYVPPLDSVCRALGLY